MFLKLSKCHFRVKELPVLGHIVTNEGPQAKQAKYYDRRRRPAEYKMGDQVFIYQHQCDEHKSEKLSLPWSGPYHVLEKMSDVTYKVVGYENKDWERIVHISNMKPYINADELIQHFNEVLEDEVADKDRGM